MRTHNSDFLREISSDDTSSTSNSSSSNSSLLNSVSQNIAPYRMITRTNTLLKKMFFSGKLILPSAIFMNLIGNVGAQDTSLPGEIWELFKSRLCALIFLQSEVSTLKADRRFIKQGYFPDINVTSEIESIEGTPKLSRHSTHGENASIRLETLTNRIYTLISNLRVILISGNIDRQPADHASHLCQNDVLDMNNCPNLYDFLDETTPISTTVATVTDSYYSTTEPVTISAVIENTDYATTAIATATATATVVTSSTTSVTAPIIIENTTYSTVTPYSFNDTTAYSVLPDIESTDSSAISIPLIIIAILSLFALVICLVRYKRRHNYNPGIARYMRSVLGREERVELGSLAALEDPTTPPVENSYEEVPLRKKNCPGNERSSCEVDMCLDDDEENIYETID